MVTFSGKAERRGGRLRLISAPIPISRARSALGSPETMDCRGPVVYTNRREVTRMRTILAKAFVALAITTVGALGADNSLGTWKLNTETSKFTPGPSPVKSLTVAREASDG